jgi:hypothetical protein
MLKCCLVHVAPLGKSKPAAASYASFAGRGVAGTAPLVGVGAEEGGWFNRPGRRGRLVDAWGDGATPRELPTHAYGNF